eukprot:2490436-Rhodomonas_salina.1
MGSLAGSLLRSALLDVRLRAPSSCPQPPPPRQVARSALASPLRSQRLFLAARASACGEDLFRFSARPPRLSMGMSEAKLRKNKPESSRAWVPGTTCGVGGEGRVEGREDEGSAVDGGAALKVEAQRFRHRLLVLEQHERTACSPIHRASTRDSGKHAREIKRD